MRDIKVAELPNKSERTEHLQMLFRRGADPWANPRLRTWGPPLWCRTPREVGVRTAGCQQGI